MGGLTLLLALFVPPSGLSSSGALLGSAGVRSAIERPSHGFADDDTGIGRCAAELPVGPALSKLYDVPSDDDDPGNDACKDERSADD